MAWKWLRKVADKFVHLIEVFKFDEQASPNERLVVAF